MNVMLCDVDVVVVVAVLVESGDLTARPDVAGHSVRDNGTTGGQVFAYNLCQSWVLSVRDVVE